MTLEEWKEQFENGGLDHTNIESILFDWTKDQKSYQASLNSLNNILIESRKKNEELEEDVKELSGWIKRKNILIEKLIDALAKYETT